MFPSEHLPLVLVTVALLGITFILYRELRAVKAAVATISVPITATFEEMPHEDEEEHDKTDDPALKSPKKSNSTS
jgi:hypothetical protein